MNLSTNPKPKRMLHGWWWRRMHGDEMAGDTRRSRGADGWMAEAGRACMRDYGCAATKPCQPPAKSRVVLGAACSRGGPVASTSIHQSPLIMVIWNLPIINANSICFWTLKLFKPYLRGWFKKEQFWLHLHDTSQPTRK